MTPMTTPRVIAVAVLALLAGGCGGSSAPVEPTIAPPLARSMPAESVGPPTFADVTSGSGVNATYRNGEEVKPPHLSILESLGGGLAAFDFDGDGLLDLYVPGGGHFTGPENRTISGHPGKLFRNLGQFKFEDVTAKAGLSTLAGGQPWFYSHAAVVGDYDRDGWPDLLVTGYGHLALFHNESDGSGGRRFVDVTANSGLDKGVKWATSAAWADFDGDGSADLFVCQYVDWSWANNPPCTYDGSTPDVCPPKKFKGQPALLYRNMGGGKFAEVATAAGLNVGPGGKSLVSDAKGLGTVVVDVNGDGKPDIYQANDTTPNFLYLNRSTLGKLAFEERGYLAGVAVDGGGGANGSMGVDAGDPDGSGKPSLWVTNYENELHALYKNLSVGQAPEQVSFQFFTPASGIAAIGQKFVGWGTGFVDLDRDGWEDVFVANGHAIRYPTGTTRKQRPVLLLNQGQGKFKDVSLTRGGEYFGTTAMSADERKQCVHLSRGVALADLDNDGKVDVAICHMNEPVTLLRNVSPDGPHWLGVKLVGTKNADVVGAKVELTAGGRTQTRFAKGGGSYASTPDRRFVFGLGPTDKIDQLVVVWPDGQRQKWPVPTVDRYLTLTQGDAAAK